MRHHGTILCIFVVMAMSLTSGSVRATDIFGAFLDEMGMPVVEVTAAMDEPITLDFGIAVGAPVSMESYLLNFSASPAIGFIDWTDATGGSSHFLPGLGLIGTPSPSPTLLLPPISAPFTILGSLTFCNTTSELALLDLSAPGALGSAIDDGSELHPIILPPLAIVPGGGPVDPPTPITDPPPVPVSYNMGTIVNGDFEAGGGSLNGWDEYAGYDYGYGNNSSVGTQTLTNGHSDTVAVLHSEGVYEPMGPYMEYMGGYCTISQEVYVPVDATELTFTYASQEQILLAEGSTNARVSLGGETETLDIAGNWTTVTLPVPEEMRGRRQELEFYASDYGSDYSGNEELHNLLDLYIDYVGINGTTALQTSTWTNDGGEQWGDAGNWDSASVPDNSTATAHDVVVPETSAGGAIEVSAARTIQSLDYARLAGPLTINPGGSLHIVDFMNIYGGSVNIHPGGSATGGNALSVEGTVMVGQLNSGQPASMAILDATVTAKKFNIYDDSTVTLGRSAGFSGQTRLEASQSISVGVSSRLELGPGSAVATPSLGISSGGTVALQDAAILRSGSSSTVSNYGTVTFSGNCTVEPSFTNDQEVVFNGANVTFDGTLRHRGNRSGNRMHLIDSTVTVLDCYIDSGADSILVDAGSALRVQRDFKNYCDTASEFDFDEGSLVFTSDTDSDLWVRGANQGPFSFGFDENFGFGDLTLEQGDLTFQQSVGGRAQYVRNLTVAAGSTLDLNGIPLYYIGDFVNDGQVIGGEIRQAYQRAAGLPTPSIASYSISAMANDTTDSSTDAPLEISGERWPMFMDDVEYFEVSYAEAHGSIENGDDCCRLSLEVSVDSGYAQTMWWDEEFIPAEASVEMEAVFSVAADGSCPEGSAVELLILASLTGDPGDWGANVYRGEELIATFSDSLSDITIDATAGETLRIEAWLEDFAQFDYWEGSLVSTLDVSVYTLSSVPEPSMAVMLGMAAVGLAGRFFVRKNVF